LLIVLVFIGHAGCEPPPSESSAVSTRQALNGDWWDNTWLRRVKLTVNNAGRGPLTDVPVLIRLNTSRVTFSELQATGTDLRFIADDDLTVLPHQVERFVSGTAAEVWVRLPQVPGSSTTHTFWMYYGNPTAPDAQSPAAVRPSFRGVWHFTESPAGGAGAIEDSTPFAHHGTSSGGMMANDLLAARIGNGLRFDGQNDYVSMGLPPGLEITGPISLEAWVYLGVVQSSVSPFTRIVNKWSGSSGGYALMFGNAPGIVIMDTADGTTIDEASAATTLPQATWQYLAGSWDPTLGSALYLNGVVTDANPPFTAAILPSPQPFTLASTGGSLYLNGRLDEVRVSGVARSPDWVSAQFASMSDSLLTYGPVEVRHLSTRVQMPVLTPASWTRVLMLGLTPVRWTRAPTPARWTRGLTPAPPRPADPGLGWAATAELFPPRGGSLFFS
jgi:biopolymer transport protein ExbB